MYNLIMEDAYMKTTLLLLPTDRRINQFFELSGLRTGEEDIEIKRTLLTLEIIDYNRSERLLARITQSVPNGFNQRTLDDLEHRAMIKLSGASEGADELDENDVKTIIRPTAVVVAGKTCNIFLDRNGNRCMYVEEDNEIRMLDVNLGGRSNE